GLQPAVGGDRPGRHIDARRRGDCDGPDRPLRVGCRVPRPLYSRPGQGGEGRVGRTRSRHPELVFRIQGRAARSSESVYRNGGPAFPWTLKRVQGDESGLDLSPLSGRNSLMDGIIEAPSPNQDERTHPVSIIVPHYTGMQDAASAIARLRDPDSRVSAHYVVAEDGQTFRLVPEERRAWPARRSCWRGPTGLYRYSVGLEFVILG